MIAAIEAGEVSHVLVKDLSRVGRDYLQVGFYTEVMFREHGVRFVAIANGVDSDKRESSEFAVYLDELGDFAECGLCGTAAVISPVGKIVDHGKEICFPSGMEEMGPVTKKLYETLTGIQMGHIEAPEGWICKIC